VPLTIGSRIVGVFDVDSPQIARFAGGDRVGMEALVGAFVRSVS
jgi:putative methionine-R-sulfoxide reductase with GAF domain